MYDAGCISLVFYIKPQLDSRTTVWFTGCISLVFYIKPQHKRSYRVEPYCCISLVFYIKPQRIQASYPRSQVVYLQFSTSNHNQQKDNIKLIWLYIFSFLHQTTTLALRRAEAARCISLVFYIKPQLCETYVIFRNCCISLVFYIKPQLSQMPDAISLCCISLVFYIKPQLQ